jgi:hypothetical protein
MNHYPLTLQFSVGTSVNSHQMITDLSKNVQRGFFLLVQYFINQLHSELFKVVLKNLSFVNGKIQLDLSISTKNNYPYLVDKVDTVEYWNFPHVICSISDQKYSIVDMKFI